MIRSSLLVTVLLGISTYASVQAAAPKLVVVISIDQYRADYLERFSRAYLPAFSKGKVGGFEYLKQRGAYYADAHYNHIPTATGPGHATILSGSIPALTGIVDNDWYDRATQKSVYCVDDSTVQTIGGKSNPMSPRNLLTTTVGDELEMATNGKSKTVGISFKDRAAILLAGHAADTVLWFDSGNAAWVTSSFYAPKLPNWVEELNNTKRPDKELDKSWTPLLPSSAYEFTRKPPFDKSSSTEPLFSHSTAGKEKSRYKNWTTSSYGQEYVFDTVQRAIVEEKLGQDEVPDLLAVNLATNDYIGHVYGPNSPEVMDISVRTDRLLSNLFNFLDKQVPGGLQNVTIVLTADHGVLPIVEEEKSVYRLTAYRLNEEEIEQQINQALSAKYGEGKWVENFHAPYLYLNKNLIASKSLFADNVETAAAEAAQNIEGIYGAVTAMQIRNGLLADLPWLKKAANSFYAKRSGDVILFESPGSIFGDGTGTGHGSPWAYDSHVPLLLAGAGIHTGKFMRTVSPADIASTLCQILGIEQPSGNVGSPLKESLENNK